MVEHLFSGVLVDPESATLAVTYASNPGTEDFGTPNNQVDPVGFPVNARAYKVLRFNVPTGGPSNATTATVYKNGVATTLTCTIAGGSPANTQAVDNNPAHAVAFVDGDRLDVRISCTGPFGGNFGFSGSVEGS